MINKITNEEKFLIYYNFLIQENEKYNLTNITIKEEVYYKHFYDSIQMEKIVDLTKDLKICDVGSGAGFPGIPLKILYPNIQLTIIEPTTKRCNFLKQLVSLLELKDVTIINDRAENVKDKKFDIVCARAVSNMAILLELCIPLCEVNGYFIAYKGANYQEEINNSQNCLKKLFTKIEKIYEYDLEHYGKHCLIKFKKIEKTPSIYPRIYSKIKAKPL